MGTTVGYRIPCDLNECNYQATSKKDLKNHKKDIHVC